MYFAHWRHADPVPAGPTTDPTMPGVWHGRHCSACFTVTGMTRPCSDPWTSRVPGDLFVGWLVACLLNVPAGLSQERNLLGLFVCRFVGCLSSQQHASVSQGRICTDNFTCCHTHIEAADQTFHLTQSQYTDTGPTSPSAGPIMPGAWQGIHWSANFEDTGMTRPGKIPSQAGFEPGIFRSQSGRLNH